jgi:methylenetetrahydrofolate--tRNA-(uracil-5-)-methyltransferase
MPPVKSIGAGLAGAEAAWQCARRGIAVELYEMRPGKSTPAHQTPDFAELVCSNSLKSESENTAPWLLKEEMRRAGSLLLEIARQCSVPAGHALAVDRVEFSRRVTQKISAEPLIQIRREEVTRINEREVTIIATGPLTSEGLCDEVKRLSRRAMPGAQEQLYFYDSISPIVEAGSIELSKVYMAARYDKGSADYINCPLSKEEYDRFYDALIAAESVEAKDWEKLNYFEGCLPIEEIARRGRHLTVWANEAGGPERPANWKDSVRGCSTAAGEFARRVVQSGWFSKPFEIRRAGASIPAHSRARTGAFFALRPDTSKYLHQLARAAFFHLANEGASVAFICRPDLRS